MILEHLNKHEKRHIYLEMMSRYEVRFHKLIHYNFHSTQHNHFEYEVLVNNQKILKIVKYVSDVIEIIDENKFLDYNKKFENTNVELIKTFRNLSLLFNDSPITHFDIDLPNVENTRYMFAGCKNLVYFKSKMPNAKDTKGMFKGCSEEFFQNYPHLRDL